MKVLRVLLWAICVLLILCGILMLSSGASSSLPGLLICLTIVLIPAIILQNKATKNSPKKQPKPKAGSEYDAYAEMTFKDGFGALPPGSYCMLGIKGDSLEFKTSSLPSTPPAATLPISQVTNVGFFTETELIEKSRSVIGRGIAGGLVFGPVGAIVGGLSGTKNKQKKKQHSYLILNYIPSGGSDPVVLTFEEIFPSLKNVSFAKALRERITPKTIEL